MTNTLKKLTDFPEYAAAQARMGELAADLKSAKAKVDESLEVIGTQDSLKAAAEGLLAGEPLEDSALAQKTARSELAKHRGQSEILVEAMKLLAKSTDEIQAKCSKIVRDETHPEYLEHVLNVARTAVSNAKAISDLHGYFNRLEDGGFSRGALTDAIYSRGSNWTDRGAYVHTYLKGLKQCGIQKELQRAGLLEPDEFAPPEPKPNFDLAGHEGLYAGPDGPARMVIADGKGGFTETKRVA